MPGPDGEVDHSSKDTFRQLLADRACGRTRDYQVVANDPVILKRWLPWVHKFISNAKAWVIGTHHGVKSSYLHRYLAEYTYRFNRRHDPDSLFHRALTACALTAPATLRVLCA